MMHNNPPPLGPSSGLWRLEDTPVASSDEGPVALLRSICTLALQYKATLLVCMAAGIGIAAVYARSLPPVYTATSTILLEPRRQATVSGQDSGTSQNLDLNRADSELQIIRSERLLSMVFDSLHLEDSSEVRQQPPQLSDRLISEAQRIYPFLILQFQRLGISPDLGPSTSAQAPGADPQTEDIRLRQSAFEKFVGLLSARRVGQSYVIEISYSASDPALAARAANAAVSAYILQSVSFKAQMARAGTDLFQGRLNALAAQVDAATEAMKRGMLPAIATPDADARIIGAALPPLTPSGPRSKLIVMLGGVLGLLGALSTLALNVGLDRKVRSAKQLNRDTGLPCLGVVPRLRKRQATVENALFLIRRPQTKYSAAVRDIRTSIEMACSSVRKDKNLVVALVGLQSGNDVSMLCMSLAHLTWHGGRYVTLFKGEYGLPDQTAYGSLTGTGASLADMLIGDILPEKVKFGNIDGVAILPILSSDPETNLYADFHDPRVGRLMDAARFRGHVLLDLPPLDSSLDALALAAHADAVLICCTLGKDTTEAVGDALQHLRRSGANVIGTVINRVNT
jgi:capsular polysaccharide biosynthesis protein